MCKVWDSEPGLGGAPEALWDALPRRRLRPRTGSSLLTWPLCCVVSGWRRMPLLLPPCRVLAPGTWVRSLRLVLPHPSPHLLPAGSLVCGLIWSQARVNLGSAQPQGSGSHPMKPGGSTARVDLASTCRFADFAGFSLKSFFLLS